MLCSYEVTSGLDRMDLDILRVELFMDGSFRNAFCSDNKEKTTYECE